MLNRILNVFVLPVRVRAASKFRTDSLSVALHTHRRRATDPIAIQVMNIVITSSPGRTASAAWTLGKQTPQLCMHSCVRLNGRCAASRPRQSMRARVVDASQPEISHHIA